MAKAIALRADRGADDLRRLARAGRDASPARRLLALAAIWGASRTQAARIGGVGLRILRDRVVRYNAEGPAGLVDREAPGRPPRLTPQQRVAPARAVEAGPRPEVQGLVPGRLVDLLRWLRDEFDVSLGRQRLGRELRRRGFRKLSAPPQDHAQDLEALEAFKGTFPSSWRPSAPACPRRLRSSSAGGTRRGQVRRTRSCADGRGGGPAPCAARPAPDGGPASSAPSARRRARPPAW